MDCLKYNKEKYTINDVSRLTGLSQKRIRDYEKQGFVKPRREKRTNNRIYVDSDVRKIYRIKQLIHEHGFTLSCLKYFLASSPCWIIFNCTERDGCPANNSFDKPCYEIMQDANSSHSVKCQTCTIFLNRKTESFPLFDKPS